MREAENLPRFLARWESSGFEAARTRLDKWLRPLEERRRLGGALSLRRAELVLAYTTYRDLLAQLRELKRKRRGERNWYTPGDLRSILDRLGSLGRRIVVPRRLRQGASPSALALDLTGAMFNREPEYLPKAFVRVRHEQEILAGLPPRSRRKPS